MTKHKIYRTLLVVTIASAPLIFVPSYVSADSGDDTTMPQSIMERIMNVFHLKEVDVQDFVAQHRSERQNENQKRMEERLDTAVKNGVITESQKMKILEKSQEFRNKMRNTDPFSMSRDERRNMVDEHRSEMRKWAEESGINLNEIYGNNNGMKGYGNGYRKGLDEDMNQQSRGLGQGQGFRQGQRQGQGQGQRMGMWNN